MGLAGGGRAGGRRGRATGAPRLRAASLRVDSCRCTRCRLDSGAPLYLRARLDRAEALGNTLPPGALSLARARAEGRILAQRHADLARVGSRVAGKQIAS